MPLHQLIRQASDVVRNLTKARRSDEAELREQAQSTLAALDSDHPGQSAVQQAWQLVRDLSNADEKSFDSLRKKAEGLKDQLDAGSKPIRQRSASTSSRDVDAWILDMFRATESAIPRETLMNDFIKRYRQERHINDSAKHKGPWLFEFEAVTEQGKLAGIRPLASVGIHPDAFEQYCLKFLPQWEDDPFLPEVLRHQQNIEVWHAPSFGGSPLFDALLDIRRQFHGRITGSAP